VQTITQEHGRERYIKIEDVSPETMVKLLEAVAEKKQDPNCNFDDMDAADVAIKFGRLVEKEWKS
jgi:hypothetical protein